MKQQINNLFWQFEENIFVYQGIYPYQTELVFAFADYIEKLSDADLQQLLPNLNPEQVKKLVNKGTDKWLQKYAKTMFLL